MKARRFHKGDAWLLCVIVLYSGMLWSAVHSTPLLMHGVRTGFVYLGLALVLFFLGGWAGERFVAYHDQMQGRVLDAIELYIYPGQASVDEVAEVFMAMSELHRAGGGKGLHFEIDHAGTKVVDGIPHVHVYAHAKS